MPRDLDHSNISFFGAWRFISTLIPSSSYHAMDVNRISLSRADPDLNLFLMGLPGTHFELDFDLSRFYLMLLQDCALFHLVSSHPACPCPSPHFTWAFLIISHIRHGTIYRRCHHHALPPSFICQKIDSSVTYLNCLSFLFSCFMFRTDGKVAL